MTTEPGRIIVKIADEPLDSVRSVSLQFRSITLVSKDGRDQVRAFESPKVVDILSLREGRTALLADWQLPSGEYKAIRLSVDAQQSVRDSYVSLHTGEECEIVVREPAGWTVSWPAGRISDDPTRPTVVLLHIDLFSSVRRVDCVQGVDFVPAIDLVDEARSGWFEGYIDLALYSSECRPKLYVWHLDDPYTPDLSPVRKPLTVTGVYERDGRAVYRTRNLYPLTKQDPNGSQARCPVEWGTYGFCPRSASYSLSFTCDNDDPNVEEALNFRGVSGGVIVEGKASRVDIVAPREPEDSFIRYGADTHAGEGIDQPVGHQQLRRARL